jgi:hypothetical protein
MTRYVVLCCKNSGRKKWFISDSFDKKTALKSLFIKSFSTQKQQQAEGSKVDKQSCFVVAGISRVFLGWNCLKVVKIYIQPLLITIKTMFILIQAFPRNVEPAWNRKVIIVDRRRHPWTSVRENQFREFNKVLVTAEGGSDKKVNQNWENWFEWILTVLINFKWFKIGFSRLKIVSIVLNGFFL